MFYHLLYPLVDVHTVFNVFRYITFRTIAAVLTSMLICIVLGPWFIRLLREKNVGETIRPDGPAWHSNKSGTPTMGGILILFAAFSATLLWANLTNPFVWLILLTVLGFGAIGLWDDVKALNSPDRKGLSGRFRLALEFIIAIAMASVLVFLMDFPTTLSVPFFKEIQPDLGALYVPFAVFVIVGAANAVNLTDGLDGLATGPVIIASGTYLLFTYITGNYKIAQYLQIPFISGVGEVTILCGALVGAGMGFLWFNTYPAEIFMGDVGSLSLGAALGSVAVMTKHEILLAIVGGIFVIEALSVIFQVTAFKVKGRRIFRMAPIHHHFEIKGWAEPKIIVRFWILSIFLALLALSTLKLR